MAESLRYLMSLVGIYYFLQGLSGNEGLHNQARKFYLRRTFGSGSEQLANFSFLITIPWMIKPIYGIIADFFPILGYRIKSYFLIGSILTALAYSGVFLWGYSYSSLLFFLFISAVGIASSDVLCDKLMVVKGQPLDATDRLQSAQWFAISLAGVINSFVGGYIAEYIPVQKAVLFSLPFALFVIPVTLFSWGEERTASASTAASEAWAGLKSAVKLRPLWGCAAFLFLYNFSPNLQDTLYVYEDKILGFSQILIGHVDTAGNIGLMVGSLLFWKVCKRFSRETLLKGIIVSGTLSALIYLFFTDPISAFAVNFLNSLVGAIAFLGTLTLAAQVCPKNAEGTVFALLMSVINFSQKLGNKVGGRLFDSFGFSWLVIISAAFTAFMWFFLPLVRQKNSSKDA